MASVAIATFADRLAEAVERKRSQLVVGLDPRLDLLPVELRGEAVLGRAEAANAYARFCCGIVDAVAPYVVAVKPQVAFFEALGGDGIAALERVCGYARSAGLLVIADGKRGDIGSTARAYAAAYLEPHEERGAARRTRSPSTRTSAATRSSRSCRRAACTARASSASCKTSNSGASDVQDADAARTDAASGSTSPQLVGEWGAELTGERGLSSVGAVVGATHPRAVGEARRLMPQAVLLLPGVGAQGATPADVARAFTSGPASALVTASRSVIFAYRGGGSDWRAAAGAEAARLRSRGLGGLGLVRRARDARLAGYAAPRRPRSSLPRRWRSWSCGPALENGDSDRARHDAGRDDDGRRERSARNDAGTTSERAPGARRFYVIQAGDTLA